VEIRYSQIRLASLMKLGVLANILIWVVLGLATSIAEALGVEALGPPDGDFVTNTIVYLALATIWGAISGILFSLGAFLLRFLLRLLDRDRRSRRRTRKALRIALHQLRRIPAAILWPVRGASVISPDRCSAAFR